jgi:cobalt-zinc-cadmium efflux system outer membrane protein
MSRFLRPMFRLMTGLLVVLPGVSVAQTIFESPQTSLPVARGTPDRNVQANAGSGDVPRVALDDLINAALARNPAIKSAAEHFGAQRAQVPQARSLPDPTVSISWMGNITPFSVQQGDPSSYRGLTVGEQFPYPGKLKLRGQIADRGAEAARWEYQQMQRQVVADVKVAYYSYYYDIQAITIIEQNKALLQKLESIAEALYSVGKGIQQDVLRAQVEVSRIEQRLIVLRQQEQTARARINTLLYRDPEWPLPPPALFSPAEFHATLAELYALGRQNDPGIEMDRRMIERNRYAVDLARKAYDPDFSVEYNYFQRPGLPDMHGFMVGINIPVFYRTKQREGVIEASHNLMSTQRDLDNRMTSVNFDITQQYLAATASRDLSNLYSKAIVPQSSLALESSMSAYEVGKLDFLSMLGNLINVLDYEVNYYQELTAFQTALSRLEPLVGTELTK